MLFIDELKNNPHAKVVLNGILGGTVTGYITEDLTIQGGADYNSAGQHARLDDLNKFVTYGTRIVGATQVQMKSIAATVVTWQGNDYFQFQLNMAFVATSPSDDVRDPVRKLMSAMYPKMGHVISHPPNEYIAKIESADNVISVHIGKWFTTPPMFVMRNCTAIMSKEVIKSGLPLYSTATVDLQAFRQLSYDQVQGFISPYKSGFSNPSST